MVPLGVIFIIFILQFQNIKAKMNKRKSQSTISLAKLHQQKRRKKNQDDQKAGKSTQDSQGGNLHYALNKMLPDVLTTQDLDNQIDQLHQENPNLTRDQCGIEGQTWHINCIPKALCAKYGKGNFLFRRLKPAEFNHVIFTTGNGKFLATGTLNYKLFPESSSEGNWQTAICIDSDTNELHCFNSPQPLNLLEWLPKSNDYDGYLNPISRVYQLTLL
jgi:hypothetical protein